ncbi:MAG: hypothetical protein FD177_2685 [Desulfovibrionaceae bacterium]|nr:MAG: hypothetical protein FD177_2685 [Desulfovibrionaceae bacterium]
MLFMSLKRRCVWQTPQRTPLPSSPVRSRDANITRSKTRCEFAPRAFPALTGSRRTLRLRPYGNTLEKMSLL